MNGGMFFAFRIALCCVVLDSMALPTQHLTRGSTRQLFRFLSSRVEEQTSRRSERHLASCNSLLSSAGFNLVAGTAASITLSGSSFSANTRINIVALGQACDGSVYQNAPNTQSLAPSLFDTSSVVFSGIIAPSSGRCQVCLSCGTGEIFDFFAGPLTVTPNVVFNHTFHLYESMSAYVEIYGFGLDYIDRILFVDSDSSCSENSVVSSTAPATKSIIPVITYRMYYALVSLYLSS